MGTEVIKAVELPDAICGWHRPPDEFDVMLEDQTVWKAGLTLERFEWLMENLVEHMTGLGYEVGRYRVEETLATVWKFRKAG